VFAVGAILVLLTIQLRDEGAGTAPARPEAAAAT